MKHCVFPQDPKIYTPNKKKHTHEVGVLFHKEVPRDTFYTTNIKWINLNKEDCEEKGHR